MAFFDPLRPAYIADPYPALAALRKTAPVHHSPDMASWIVTSYEQCLRILRDEEYFSSNPINAGGPFGQMIAERRESVPLGLATILGNSDDPQHATLRTIVNRAFTPRAITAMRPVIDGAITELLDHLPAGPFDVMTQFAEPLAPSMVLAHLGIPEEARGMFRQASLEIMRARAEGPENPAVVQAADAAVETLMQALQQWDEAGTAREGSVVSTLFAAAHAGEELEPDDLLMLLIHISLAGNGPTAMAIGNAALHLATHPEASAQLRADPGLIPAAVEELLRFDSATHAVARFALKDTPLGARKIKAGESLYAMIGAANRDPAEFENPGELDFARTENRHLSFGFGMHFCLGAPLARLEMQAVIEALITRFGTFSLIEAERGGSFMVRGPRRLVIAPG